MSPLETVSIDELERRVRTAIQEQDFTFLDVAIEELEERPSHGLKELVAECKVLVCGVPEKHKKSFSLNSSNVQIHKPTEEQENAISLFHEGGSLKINAYAGAGKTSTLVMLAKQSKRKGVYFAYNSAIVKEAEHKLPRNVKCFTMHKLARRKVSPKMNQNDDKLNKAATPFQVAEKLKLQALVIGDIFKLSRIALAFLIRETVKKFMQSGASGITGKHIPAIGAFRNIPLGVEETVTQLIVGNAEKLWKKMCDPGDSIPLGHDGYLKFWALNDAKIDADFILLDEAQDTNEVVLEVLKKQEAQLVYVGDKYQQIYEWRGAVNAMGSLDTEHTTSLTRSFRFGQEIADYASNVLRLLRETESIQGNDECDSRIGAVEPDAILARTNGSVMAAAMDALRMNRCPHLVGGNQELVMLLQGAQAIQNGRESQIPALFGFKSWGQVVEFSQTDEGIELRSFVKLVEKHGIPNLMKVIDKTYDEEDCDFVISTAHKAKGREWRNVSLMGDFLLPPKKEAVPAGKKGARFEDAELRLFYVAVTRAKTGLYLPMELLSKIPLMAY